MCQKFDSRALYSSLITERLRNSLAASIKNTQTICSKDVENICLGEGEYANAHGSAVTNWTMQYKRHMFKHFKEVSTFTSLHDDCHFFPIVAYAH